MSKSSTPKYIVSSQDRKRARRKIRPVIYQVFPRIFTNRNENCQRNGTLQENGCGKFNDYTPELLGYIRNIGATAVWYTGVVEMATKTDFSEYGIEPYNANIVKGEAGSPYAITDLYDVSPALAVDVPHRLEEFKALIARTHSTGLDCIIDFVPNHTARRYHSDSAPQGVKDIGADDDVCMFFSPTNDYYYITNQQFVPSFDISEPPHPYVEFPAKATGNDCFSAFCSRNDWYETAKLNYGHDYGDGSDHFHPIPPLWHKMVSVLRYWLSLGVDGFRCDMVFMVPLEFWHWAIPMVKKDYPDAVFIGEIYDIGQYRPFLQYGCFDYLYDKVNLYDTIVGIERSNYSTARLTGCWQALEGISDRMLNFLENHDEVRYGSEEFAGNPLSVLPSLVVSTMFSTGPYMIYYGQEIGESAKDNEGFAGMNHRSTIYDYWSYDSMRRLTSDPAGGTHLTSQERWLRSVYSKVLNMINDDAAIREGTFFDLMYVNLSNPGFDPHRHFAFLRHHGFRTLLIAVNFGQNESDIDIIIPSAAFKMMHLPELNGAKVQDLLSGDTHIINLQHDSPTSLHLEARGALVIEINLNPIIYTVKRVKTRRQNQQTHN